MRRIAFCLAVAGLFSNPVSAQNNNIFGGLKHDRTAPIEITANSLEVRQEEEIAIFTGDVVAGQGTMRLTADMMEVMFDQDKQTEDETGAITNVEAKGNVFLTNGAETAQGSWAEYDLDTGIVKMGGDVYLTQGTQNAAKGQSLVVDLNTGVAKLEGRVGLTFRSQQPAEGGATTPKCTPEQQAIAEANNLLCIPKSPTN
ncbi:MAG: LptA/OstA family protein [Pseudomonadota bacterium]